jgi:hypothetical protein
MSREMSPSEVLRRAKELFRKSEVSLRQASNYLHALVEYLPGHATNLHYEGYIRKAAQFNDLAEMGIQMFIEHELDHAIELAEKGRWMPLAAGTDEEVAEQLTSMLPDDGEEV